MSNPASVVLLAPVFLFMGWLFLYVGGRLWAAGWKRTMEEKRSKKIGTKTGTKRKTA